MRKFFIFILSVILFTQACKHTDKDVLNIEEMKKVMFDMMLVDEFSGTYLSRDSVLIKDSTRTVNGETMKLYEKVFALHKIDAARFQKSYNYYRANPLKFRELTDSLNTYAVRERDKPKEVEKARDTATKKAILVDSALTK